MEFYNESAVNVVFAEYILDGSVSCDRIPAKL